MPLNLEIIRSNPDFEVSERELDGDKVFLITPHPSKHKWAPDELHLRSVLTDASGVIISSGFHKFMNYGEDLTQDAITHKMFFSEFSEGMIVTEKLDGSLLIRFVYKGKVYFRTRGNHVINSPMKERVESLLTPEMKDPSLYSGVSVLFEYTHPEDQIILAEPPMIRALGIVDTSQPIPQTVLSRELLDGIAETFKVAAVPCYGTALNLNAYRDALKATRNREGIVMWYPSHELPYYTHMVKIKTDWYIKIHALHSHMTPEKLRVFCWREGITSESELEERLNSVGIDWESVQFLLPSFNEYVNQRYWYQGQAAELEREMQQAGLLNSDTNRKTIALWLKERTEAGDSPPYKGFFNYGMMHALGKEDLKREHLNALILGVSHMQLKNLSVVSILEPTCPE